MATQADLQTTSEVVGDWLSNELERTDRLETTADELAARLSLPTDEIETVLERLAADPTVPISRDGASWVLSR